jgi:hypothetical protein
MYSSRGGTVSSCLCEPFLYALLMLSIPQMNLKIVDRHSRTGSIQLTRTIVTANPRKILILQSVTRLAICVRDW